MMFGLIAAILEVIGLILIGNRSALGFVLNIVVCWLWIIYIFTEQTTYQLLIVCVPMIIVNIRNILKWKGIKMKIKIPKIFKPKKEKKVVKTVKYLQDECWSCARFVNNEKR